MINKLCIIGVGLIGGSVARAARSHNPALTIIGYGRPADIENLQLAKALGVIDGFSVDISEAVQNADCVVIATPVGTVATILALLKPDWSATTLYTDVGSTKGSVISACLKVFGEVPNNFVPAHPIAGAEQSGVGAAKAELFQQKCVIITPVATTADQAVSRIRSFWETLGAKVALMDYEQHDAVLAATSHLPHVLAFALVDLLGRKDEQAAIFKYAAGGFRDFTRIASSDPTMWLDICMANQQELIPLLGELMAELAKLQTILQEGNTEALFSCFQHANEARQRFLAQFEC